MEKEELEIALKKIEILSGFELPIEFKEFYRKYNGGIINNVRFLRTDEIITEMVNSENVFEEIIKIKIEPEKSIRKVCYMSSRVPFISDDSGNYIGIDFKPGTKGVSGQIINYGIDENLMKVFANSFKDFMDMFLQIEINNEKIYVTDYLLTNGLDNIKDVAEENLPKKVKYPKLEVVNKTEEKLITFNRLVDFNMDYLKDIISILEKLIIDIKVDMNVIKYLITVQNYRIKNYNDFYSRTMLDSNSFWEKLEDYDKSEIKGFSFTLKIQLEENENNKLKNVGDESIFIDIDRETVLIKYRQKMGNKAYINAYEKLVEYFNNIIKLEE